MDLKELEIDKNIHFSIDVLTKAINNKYGKESEIWKAYSWLEYTILLVRLNKYNLLDEEQQEELKTKKKRVVPNSILNNARDLLLRVNYGDEDQVLNSLRSSRDLLKIFLKRKKRIDKKQIY